MPTLHSLTHCQAAPINAQTKAWQRVRLSQRTRKTTDKQADEKEARLPNITYTQAGVWCFVRQGSTKIKVQFFVGSSVVEIPACV